MAEGGDAGPVVGDSADGVVERGFDKEGVSYFFRGLVNPYLQDLYFSVSIPPPPEVCIPCAAA